MPDATNPREIEALAKRLREPISCTMRLPCKPGKASTLCDPCLGADAIEALVKENATLRTTCETFATAAEIAEKHHVIAFRIAAAGLFLADGDSHRELDSLRAIKERLRDRLSIFDDPDDPDPDLCVGEKYIAGLLNFCLTGNPYCPEPCEVCD